MKLGRLLVAAVGVLLACSASSGPLRLSGDSGHLRIANDTHSPIEVSTPIVVEQKGTQGWRTLRSEFNAVRACDVPLSATMRIAAQSAVDVVAWRGFSCSSQCNWTCRANIYFGPGPFRFRVHVPRGDVSILSPAFEMPARPEHDVRR